MQQVGRVRRLGPSWGTPWGLFAWLTVPVTALVSAGPIRDPDVYWHIRMGQDILANGRFGGDPSWTYGPADASWRTTQAASEIVLHGIHLIASWPGIMAFRVVMSAALMVSVLLAATAVIGRRPTVVTDRAVAVTALLAAVMAPSLVQERPQSLSLLVLPWIGVLLLRVLYADRWPRWWVIGPVVMVWAWFHGAAVLVGPLLLGSAVIHAVGSGRGEILRRLGTSARRGWPSLVAVAIAPMIGPLGIDYYAQALRIQAAASGRIVEWMAPSADSVAMWLVLALLAVWGVAAVHVAARSGMVWRTLRMDAVAVGGLTLLMTTANRYVAVGILLLGPLVARRVAQAWIAPPRRLESIQPAFSAAVVAVVGAAALVVTVMGAVTTRPVAASYPLAIWQGLSAQQGERRVLVDYTLGGQAGMLGGAVVSIDGRADRYGAEVIDATRAFAAGRPGWPDTLAAYPGTTDIVIPSYGGVAPQLEARGWSVRCRVGEYVWLTAPGVTGECPPERPD